MQNLELDRGIAPVGRAAERTVGKNGRHAINVPVNIALMVVVLVGTAFQLFGLPCALRLCGWHAAWLVLPIMLLQPVHWGLIHEAIHSHLLPSRRADKFFGRLLSITVGVPFEVTRFSHLVHHRFSRHGYDRADMHDGNGLYVLAWLRYWGRLFGGVYLGILSSPLIACIPMKLGVRLMERAIPIHEAGDVVIRRLFTSLVMDKSKRSGMRRDFALTILLYAASAWAYGEWWPVLLAAVYARALWHSLADNVAHHGVALDEPERARNYALPRPLGAMVMNQNLHLTHHLHPQAPWTKLDSIQGGAAKSRSGNYFRAALRQIDLAYPRSAEAAARTSPATVP